MKIFALLDSDNGVYFNDNLVMVFNNRFIATKYIAENELRGYRVQLITMNLAYGGEDDGEDE